MQEAHTDPAERHAGTALKHKGSRARRPGFEPQLYALLPVLKQLTEPHCASVSRICKMGTLFFYIIFNKILEIFSILSEETNT